ncbi:MAG: hypothetical protein OXG35_12730 [Acidobacteria bacterium]|nr:hypothetical protein [Acidobacteriota bacterium]
MTEQHVREFRQKLALLLIDKALIGAFVLLLGFFVQSGLEQQRAALEEEQAERDRLAVQRERVREVTLSVSQVFTEIVNENRGPVVSAVEDLLAVLNQYESVGRVTDTDGRERLRNIVENLENALSQLARINPRLPARADPFVQRVREIRSDLVNRRREPEALREDADNLSAGYLDLLLDLRTTSVLALEEDRKAVEAILADGEF